MSEEGTMAYCASCGEQMEGQYCPKCGTPAGTVQATAFDKAGAAGSVEPGLGVNAASALCYLFGFVTGIVFLALAPYNRDRRVRFHAFQSIFLSVAAAVLHIGITIMVTIMGVVSFSLGALVSVLHAVVSLGFFLVWLYMMLKSYQGETVVLPVIGPLAQRQAGRGPDAPADTMGKAA
jgi:uncharacterized membrane protein